MMEAGTDGLELESAEVMSRNKKLGAPEDIFDVPGNKAGVMDWRVSSNPQCGKHVNRKANKKPPVGQDLSTVFFFSPPIF